LQSIDLKNLDAFCSDKIVYELLQKKIMHLNFWRSKRKKLLKWLYELGLFRQVSSQGLLVEKIKKNEIK